MDKKKLDRLERKVLRRAAQQAVERKLDLHPTYPDDEEDEDEKKLMRTERKSFNS